MTMHKPNRDRILDKNKIIAQLNETISKLNQQVTVLRFQLDTQLQLPPTPIQVIRDCGDHYKVENIIRVSQTPAYYEVLIA